MILWLHIRQVFVAEDSASKELYEGMALATSSHLAHKDLFIPRVEFELLRVDAILRKNFLRRLALIVPCRHNCCNYEVKIQVWIHVAEESTFDEGCSLKKEWILI